MATGLGIAANIIDCYAAIIRLYKDADSIFLIGFRSLPLRPVGQRNGFVHAML
jgi:hypothetical protein